MSRDFIGQKSISHEKYPKKDLLWKEPIVLCFGHSSVKFPIICMCGGQFQKLLPVDLRMPAILAQFSSRFFHEIFLGYRAFKSCI